MSALNRPSWTISSEISLQSLFAFIQLFSSIRFSTRVSINPRNELVHLVTVQKNGPSTRGTGTTKAKGRLLQVAVRVVANRWVGFVCHWWPETCSFSATDTARLCTVCSTRPSPPADSGLGPSRERNVLPSFWLISGIGRTVYNCTIGNYNCISCSWVSVAFLKEYSNLCRLPLKQVEQPYYQMSSEIRQSLPNLFRDYAEKYRHKCFH